MIKIIFYIIILLIIPSKSFASSQSWVENSSTPILNPSGSGWDKNAVFEPRVLQLSANSFFMIFTGYTAVTGFEYLGSATSTNGINWTKNVSNPVIGGGNGNESGVIQRPFLYTESGIIYVFYSDTAPGGGSIICQQSSDNGVTWTNRTVILNKSSGTPANVDAYANTSVIKVGSTYHLMVEAHMTSGAQWQIFHTTSSSILGPYTFSPGTPLTTLQINSGGVYGGPNINYLNGIYYIWYHAANGSGSLPTDIYFAKSTDAITWTPTTTPIFARANEINLSNFGSGINNNSGQTADPYIYDPGNGIVYAYYDRDYNGSPLVADIALQTFNGNLYGLLFPIAFSINNASIKNSILN